LANTIAAQLPNNKPAPLGLGYASTAASASAANLLEDTPQIDARNSALFGGTIKPIEQRSIPFDEFVQLFEKRGRRQWSAWPGGTRLSERAMRFTKRYRRIIACKAASWV
jgi:hypothetical protein